MRRRPFRLSNPRHLPSEPASRLLRPAWALALAALQIVLVSISLPHPALAAEGHEESFDPYLNLLNEFSERRRMNVYFENEQSIFHGVQIGYVNTTLGNLTFVRRDMVAVGRIPLVLARAYDSSLIEGGDFGPGWHLTAAETLRSDAGGFVYRDETASELRFVATEVGYRLSPPGPSGVESLEMLPDGRLQMRLASGLLKTFDRVRGSYVLSRVEDRNGNAIRLQYRGKKLVRIVGGEGRHIEVARGPSGRVVAVSDAQGREVTYHYDTAGRLQQVVDMGGNRWLYAYDAGGRLVHATDPLEGESFRMDYDAKGRVASAATPRATHTYRYRGSETVVTDGNGYVNVFRHGESGITVEIASALGVTSRIELDERNRPLRILRDGDTQATLRYDAEGRLSWVSRGERRSDLGFTYDEAGRLTEVRKGAGSTSSESALSFTYDRRGNVLSRRDGDGESRYRYGPRGDLIRAALAEGISYGFEHDADGQIVVLKKSVRGGNDALMPGGGTTRFEYRPDGKLARSRFADGLTHHYSYDTLGLRSGMWIEDGDREVGRVDYVHNPTGSLTEVWVTDALGDVHGNRMRLDERHRIVGLEYFGRRQFAFDYDQAGKLTQARADDDKGEEKILFEYDELNRLAAVTTVHGNTIRHEYRKGEADLQLQFDAKTGPSASGRPGTTSTFASATELLLNRVRQSAYGPVAFDPSSMSFVLAGEEGVVLPDELFRRSWQRMRLDELDRPEYRENFEQPSSILFWPAEYRALNCCIWCSVLYGVPCDCLSQGQFEITCQDCVPSWWPFPPPPIPPTITSLSKTRGLIGNVHTLTLSGNNFGTNPNVNITGSGITVQVNSASDTSISITLRIRSDATPGNRGIWVSSFNGNSSTKNFFVQVPTFVKVSSINTANLGCTGIQVGTGVRVNFTTTDQQNVGIQHPGMTPLESFRPRNCSLTNWAPFASPPTTNSSGGFVDTPVGSCFDVFTGNICVIVDQKFQVRIPTPVGPASSRTFTTGTTVERLDCRDGVRHKVRNNGTLVRSQTIGNVNGQIFFQSGC